MSRARVACKRRWRHVIRKHRLTTPDKRAKTLKRMGFTSYTDYIRSPLWRAIRAAKLEADPLCEICGKSKAQSVHHLRYNEATLRGKNVRTLVSVCNSCHYKIEFKADGEKRTYEAAMKKTKQLLIKRGRWELHKKPRPEKQVNGTTSLLTPLGTSGEERHASQPAD